MQYELVDFEDVTLPKHNPPVDKKKAGVYKLLLKNAKGERTVAIESKPIPALEKKEHGMLITIRPGEVHFGVFLLRSNDVLDVQLPASSAPSGLNGFVHDADVPMEMDYSAVDLVAAASNPAVPLPRPPTPVPTPVQDIRDVTLFAVVRKVGSKVTLDDGLKLFECSSVKSYIVGYVGFFRLGFIDGAVCIRSDS